MKVLTFMQFCEQPEGTLFSFYTPDICEGLYRKGESLYKDKERGGEPFDFILSSLIPQCLNGGAPEISNDEWRWGEYKYDQLFAVLDKPDLYAITEMLYY